MGLFSWMFGEEEEESPPEPLVLGAKLHCVYGSVDSYLYVDGDDIDVNQLPNACVEDGIAFENIHPFGRCYAGVECRTMMKLEEEWENIEPQSIMLNGKEIITTKSTLTCITTGMRIEAKTSGQDGIFAKQLIFMKEMDVKYPGLRALLEDKYQSLYLNEGMHEIGIQFLEDRLKSNGGEIELVTMLYGKENLEGDYIKLTLAKLLTDCDPRRFETFSSQLEATAIQHGMDRNMGWNKNYLNETMMDLLKQDSKETKKGIETNPARRWMEEHPMFGEWGAETAGILSYGAAMYRPVSRLHEKAGKINKVIKPVRVSKEGGKKGADIKGGSGASEGTRNPSSQLTGTTYDASKLKSTQPYTYQDQVKLLKQTIVEKGPNAVKPIEVRVHDGQALIVDGHHRLEAFKQLGYDRVPIKYIHSNQLGKIQNDGFTYYRSLEELLDGLID